MRVAVTRAGVLREAAGLTWATYFLVGLLLTPGFNSFETPSLETVEAVVREGHFWLDREPGGVYHRGEGGRVYEVHEVGSVLFAVPFAALAARAAPVLRVDFKRLYELEMGFVSAGLFATTLLLLVSVAHQLGVPASFAAPRILGLAIASQYLIYATSPPDVSLAAPLLAACLLAWLRAEAGRRRGWLLAGLFAGMLVAVKLALATIVPILLLLGLTAGQAGRRDRLVAVGAIVAGLVPGLALSGWWNALRTGSPLQTLYPSGIHGFALNLLPEGLAAALVSPNKGMLVYTPVLVLVPLTMRAGGVLAQHRRLATFVLGSFLLSMLRISGTVASSSEGGWGNRYYVPWIALFLAVLVAEWYRRRSRPGAWVASAWLGIALGGLLNLSGILTNQMYRQQLCGFDAWDIHGMNVCAVTALPGNLARVAGARIPAIVVPGASPANVFASNRLAVWWYAIRHLGVPAAASWAIAGGLLAAAIVCWRCSARRLVAVSPVPSGTPGGHADKPACA